MITGFEWEAIDECREKFGKDVRVAKQRGRIYFNIDWEQLPKVLFHAIQIIIFNIGAIKILILHLP